MRLWKNGVEQILAEAGMQNQKTERKTLHRHISTNVRRGAMCSPRRKPEKREIRSIGSFEGQEKGLHKTETVPMGPTRGYVVRKEGSRKLRHDSVATCYENRGKLDHRTAEGR